MRTRGRTEELSHAGQGPCRYPHMTDDSKEYAGLDIHQEISQKLTGCDKELYFRESIKPYRESSMLQTMDICIHTHTYKNTHTHIYTCTLGNEC